MSELTAPPASAPHSTDRRGGLIGFSIRRRVTVAMFTVTLLLFGLIALNSLKVTLLPDLSYPTLTVRTDYEGAAPAEIETLVTKPVEEALGVVKGLRKISSVSRTGQSDVVLQFSWGTDMDQAGLEVRDKLDALQLPQDAKPPVLLRFNPSTAPILRLALTSTGADSPQTLTMLRRYADDDLKKKLEPVDGVAAVKVAGGLEDEIQVDVDQQKLAQLNIPITTVIQRLQQENVNLSAGRLEQGSQRFLVRTVNQFGSVDDIRNMLLNVSAAGNQAATTAAQQMARVAAASGSADAMAAAAAVSQASGGQAVPAGGVPVRLGDVASVRQGHKEREAIIRLGGHEAVELAIYKEGDANTVATADAIQARLTQIREKLPREVALTVVDDQSQFIRHAISDVKLDAVIGGLLAVLVIFLFLRDGWSTLVVGLSLPVSIIGTFFFMGQFGLTLNVMSLGGLALATGLVVDDSIVVLESIAKARERGLGVLESALAGTREVGMAVMASTLTTVAVFLPLVFVEGIAGQLFKDQALTVAIAVLISLVVSMTLIPMLSGLKDKPPMAFAEEAPPPRWQPASRWLKPLAWIGHVFKAGVRGLVFGVSWLVLRLWRVSGRVIGPVMRLASDVAMRQYHRAEAFYLERLPAALRHPGRVLGAALVSFLLVMALVPMLGTDLIPQLAQDRFDMTVKLPPGTPLARTDAVIKRLQESHAKDPGIESLYAVSGTGTRLDASPTESGENIGKLTVIMAGGGSRQVEADETARLRSSMDQVPSAQVDFSRPELISLSKPLEVELSGDSLDAIQQAGRRLAALLREDPHFADVKTSVEQGFPEVQIRFDAERAAALGMTTRQVADIVVDKINGDVATRYNFRDRKIDVLVRSRPQDRGSIQAIRNLVINPGSGTPVTLASVADVVETEGPSEIHRADQTRVAVVSANLQGIDLGGAIERVRDIVAQHPLGADIGMSVGGQGEELASSMRSLLFAFALAVFLVYLVMASQFESLLHPFVILFTIPLALVGAVLALFVTGSSLSVVVFIGLILLVGLVVKNAIILIDKVNQLRESGVAKRDAIVQGAGSRLRPIMMTTLCSVFGFLPLALAFGQGAEVRSPMAITVIGGLIVATLLTLVVIPVVYDLLDRRSDETYRERGRRHRAAEAELDVASPEATA